MYRNIKFSLFIFVFILCSIPLCLPNISNAKAEHSPRLGMWITVFTPEKVLYSRESIDRLIDTCQRCGINDIYLQLYRADKAYYNSSLTDSTPYKNMLAETGEDTIKYLIQKAKDNGINVYAWLNLLNIAQNENAMILKKFGPEAITLDQHGRTSLQEGNKDALDKYYIRENQLFLDPGDLRVRNYLTDISAEIMEKYPSLSGLHLDYIRYPAAMPFILGSKFTSHGLSYGYTERNIENFKNKTGIDMKTVKYSRANYKAWDDFRRDQVSLLVKSISERVRAIDPAIKISCTTVPSMERTYLVTFQDWTKWLAKGWVDYIVIMNYTEDARLMELATQSFIVKPFEGKVHVGIGSWLLKEKFEILEDELMRLKKLNPAGIALFSYDDVALNEELQDFLQKEFGSTEI